MMRKREYSFWLYLSAFLVGLIVISPSYARSSGMQVSLFAGYADVSMDTNKLVYSTTETDQVINGHHHTNVVPGAGFGYDFLIEPETFGALNRLVHDIFLGLDAHYYDTTGNGDVLLFSNPQLNQLNHRLKLQSYTLMLNTEWTSFPLFKDVSLFLQAGVGGARNRVEYQDYPKAGFTTTGIHLSSHTDIDFAYEAGGGVKADLTENIQISARYLYSDLGRPHSSTQIKGDGSIVRPLTVKPRAQTWLFGLSYYLP